MAVLNNLQSLKRRWKLFGAIVLALVITQFITYRPVFKLFRSEMRFIVGTQPLDSTLLKEEERYYHWVASEYVVAGISDYINGGDFAQSVSDDLIVRGFSEMDPETTDEFISSGFERSRLILAITHPNEEMVETIAFSASNVLLSLDQVGLSESESAAPLDLPIPQLERSPAFVYPIDRDLIIDEIDLTEDVVADIWPKLLIAVVAGFAAVALAEFFDPTIRSRNSAESLAVPILAEIPGE